MDFLATVAEGDDELVRYTQRAIGYSITGDTREQCLFVLHGDGANGKTTFLNAVGTALGDYTTAADSTTFLAGVNAKALSSYMGHASVTITFDRYGT